MVFRVLVFPIHFLSAKIVNKFGITPIIMPTSVT